MDWCTFESEVNIGHLVNVNVLERFRDSSGEIDVDKFVGAVKEKEDAETIISLYEISGYGKINILSELFTKIERQMFTTLLHYPPPHAEE